MKRTLTGFALLLLLLFGVASLVKYYLHSSPIAADGGSIVVDKNKVRAFWQIYRAATQYRIAGKLDSALQKYEEALVLNAIHEDALYYGGNMYLELGDSRRAEKAWQALLRVNPVSTRAHLQLGGLYLNYTNPGHFDLDRAEAEFKQAHALNKEENGVLLRLGQTALLRGNLQLAASYLADLTGSNYKNVEAHFIVGYIAWKNGDRVRAEQFFREARDMAKPRKPVNGVHGEGDTKTGKSFQVSNYMSPFAAMVADLSEIDDGGIAVESNLRYRELDSLLADIGRKKLSTVNN